MQSVVDSQRTRPALLQDFVSPSALAFGGGGLRRLLAAISANPPMGLVLIAPPNRPSTVDVLFGGAISPLTPIVVCLSRPHPIESRLNTNPENNKLKTYCFQFKCNQAK